MVTSIALGSFDGDDQTDPYDYKGMAPGANIILLQVFPDDGSSNFAVFEAGLQWVLTNAAAYNIVSVNMSWSATNSNYNVATTAPQYGINDELQRLVNGFGIIPVSTTGNSFCNLNSAPGVAYPGADPNALAIGATWDADSQGPWIWHDWFGDPECAVDYTTGPDRIASFSQRHPTLLDVFAPGVAIDAGRAGFDLVTQGAGTSFAAPHISGIVALAQQLAVAQSGQRIPFHDNTETGQKGLETLLRETGKQIYDGDEPPLGIFGPNDENDNIVNTNAYYRRVDMLALANQIVLPKVIGVTIGSSDPNVIHADYNLPVGSGEQLRTVPVGNPNEISIAFGEEVTVEKGDLSVYGAYTGTTYNVAGSTFTYTGATRTAKWTFAAAFPADQLEITLSDAVTDTAATPAALDGEWSNPTSLTQGTSDAWPSGNGAAGGSFVIYVTTLQGDVTRDNKVDLADVNTVNNNFGLTPALWTQGDTSGDNVVGLPDKNQAQNLFGLNFTVWPEGGAGPMESTSADTIGVDALRQALRDYYALRVASGKPGPYDTLLGSDLLGDEQWWEELLGKGWQRRLKQ